MRPERLGALVRFRQDFCGCASRGRRAGRAMRQGRRCFWMTGRRSDPEKKRPRIATLISWCRGTELNCRHGDFQSPALPTELPRLNGRPLLWKSAGFGKSKNEIFQNTGCRPRSGSRGTWYGCFRRRFDGTLNAGEKKGRVVRPFDFMVPGDRVELPTRGFSVPCSTD